MKRLFLFLSLLLFLTVPKYTFAQETWTIDNFHSDLTIQENGKLKVKETFDVDFGTLAKHGIFRDIPLSYKLDTRENYYLDIDILSVRQDGKDISYQETVKAGNVDLKIGSPNRTISGKVVYTLEYEATGALRGFADHDEIYWDVTGEGWSVQITKLSATLSLANGAFLKIDCFEGEFGATKKCTSKLRDKNTAGFSATKTLNPGDGLTILASYPKGIIPILTAQPPESETTKTSGLPEFHTENFLVSFLIIFLPGTLFVFTKWWRRGRDQTNGRETLVVEYSPPDKLRPAELGTLVDERADTLDVSATIVDLAVRGYLTIAEITKKWVFGKIDYKLADKKKDLSGLLEYEKELITRIFDEDSEVKISELKTEFYNDLAIVKEKLYKNMVTKKLFPTNPEKIRKAYLVWGFVLLILGFSLFITFVFVWDILGGITLALGLFGLILTIFSRAMPRRTQTGHELYRRTLGFAEFIDKAEKYKQRFFEKRNLFNELLPYAIVFGQTEKFAKALKGMGVPPQQTTWYYGNSNFNYVVFASSINSFSGSFSGAIASTGHASFAVGGGGFSSGGGFSGGGVGGGGGGSW